MKKKKKILEKFPFEKSSICWLIEGPEDGEGGNRGGGEIRELMEEDFVSYHSNGSSFTFISSVESELIFPTPTPTSTRNVSFIFLALFRNVSLKIFVVQT